MPRIHSNLFIDIELTLQDDVSLTLVDLGRTLGVDRHTIERAVHLAAGVTFRKFKRLKQLERAQVLLKEGLLVKEVADKLGYRSSDAFSRAFNAVFGCPPRSLKRNYPQM